MDINHELRGNPIVKFVDRGNSNIPNLCNKTIIDLCLKNTIKEVPNLESLSKVSKI